MEKLFQQDKLDAAPGIMEWIYFKQLFANSIASFTVSAKGAQKLAALINCVSLNVCSCISFPATYDDAVVIFDGTHVSPKNEVHSRQILLVRKQGEADTVNKLRSQLDVLSNDCTRFRDCTGNIFAYLNDITFGGTDQADNDYKVEKFAPLVSIKYGPSLHHHKTISSVKEIEILAC